MPDHAGLIAAFGDNKADYILLGIVALVLLAVGLYYAARFMKGKLKVHLSRDSASSEELLTGRVVLETKKPIHGSLKVSLIGREKRRKRTHDGDRTNEWKVVYQYHHILEETRDFEAGFEKEYKFELLAPTGEQVRSRSRPIAKGMADAAVDGEGVVGGALKAAAGVAGAMAGRIHWHVEARLDAKGSTFTTKKSAM